MDWTGINLAPMVSLWTIVTLGGFAFAAALYGWLMGARGIFYRAGFLAAALIILLNPQLISEEQEGLTDTALVIVDDSPSQDIGERRQQILQAEDAVRKLEAGDPTLDVRMVRTSRGGANATETRIYGPLAASLTDIPKDRLAGIILVTDGNIHDNPAALGTGGPDAPVHALMTGDKAMRDRRLIVERSPEYALVDRPVSVIVRVEDQPGAASRDRARLTVRQDGRLVLDEDVRIGRSWPIAITPDHRGNILVDIGIEPLDGEVALQNNRAILNLNAVRDRLRVLLISGEPHPGERVWRTALKSDPAVDLVHFTILRLPTSQDSTPVNQLSLIPFPTDRLFDEQLNEFDLVIFDRYTLRGVLDLRYLQNLADYVEDGGAILVATGPEFVMPVSLYLTPLARVLPASPIGRLIEEGFRPELTEAGKRHPVTAGLTASASPEWGRWFRMVNADVKEGDILMRGPDDAPLLVLSHVGAGRVAQLLSDQIWLWARDVEGGGPHQELLRRLAHWLMKEPDLEEEALKAAADGLTLTIERRSLLDQEHRVSLTGPDGETQDIILTPESPGSSTARITVDRPGLYQVNDSAHEIYVGAGTLNSREFSTIIPTEERIEELVSKTGGSIHWLEDGMPDIRRVREDATSSGRSWIGLERRGASRTISIQETSLFPGFLSFLVLATLAALAWWRESR